MFTWSDVNWQLRRAKQPRRSQGHVCDVGRSWDSLESWVTDRSARSRSPSLSGLDEDNAYGPEGRDSFRGARRNARVVSYIDNMLLLVHSEEASARQGSAMILLLDALGFIMYPMKSVTMPSQKMEFLGVVVDTTSMEVRLPE